MEAVTLRPLLKRCAMMLPPVKRLILSRDAALALQQSGLERIDAKLAELQSEIRQVRRGGAAHPAPFRGETNAADERPGTYLGNGMTIRVSPDTEYPYTIFRIETAAGAVFEEPLYYAHFGLARMLTAFEFDSVLEIGSRSGTAARAFQFTGKQVTTCEILGEYASDFSGDYLDLRLPEPIGAIWCSHVLEHQRYLGRFIDKMFDDLREGGVLAITVPSALSPLLIGHCNIFTPLHLIYQLILAGFDCSEAQVRQYDMQFSVLLRKRSNGIRRISFAATDFEEPGSMGQVDALRSFFPKPVQSLIQNNAVWGEVHAINC